MTANVDIITNMVKNTVYLSREAVRQNEDNSYVMVLMDDVPIELPVTVGVQTPIYSEVLSILEPHKKVIIGDWEKLLAEVEEANKKGSSLRKILWMIRSK